MANNFSNWMERQLKDRGRADIDHESLKELYPFNIPFGEYPLIYPGINYLRLDWPRWIKGSGAVYDRLPNSGSTIPNRRERDIHHSLADVFYMEFKAIESYFREYYRNTGIFDREYFKGLVTEFRKHFPADHREPDIKYFDDLISEFIDEFEDPGAMPLSFPDFLKNKELAKVIKDELKGCKTKDYAALYLALEETGMFRYYPDVKTVYQAMIEYFGYFGNYPGFMPYLKSDTVKNLNLQGSGRIKQLSEWLIKESRLK